MSRMLSSGSVSATSAALSRVVSIPARDINLFDITDDWNSKSKDDLLKSRPAKPSKRDRNQNSEDILRKNSVFDRNGRDSREQRNDSFRTADTVLSRRRPLLDASMRQEYAENYSDVARSGSGFLKSFSSQKSSTATTKSENEDIYIDEGDDDLFGRSSTTNAKPITSPIFASTPQKTRQEILDEKIRARREEARLLLNSLPTTPEASGTEGSTLAIDDSVEVVNPSTANKRKTTVVRVSPTEERLAFQLRSMHFENEEDEEEYLARLERRATSRSHNSSSSRYSSIDELEEEAEVEIKLRYLPRSTATQRTVDYTRTMRKLVDSREPVAVVGAFLRRFYAMPGLESLLTDLPAEMASLRRVLPHRRALRVPKIKTSDLRLMKNRLRLLPDAFVFNQLAKALALEASLALPASATSVPLPPTPSLPAPKTALRESAKAALRPNRSSTTPGVLDGEDYLPHAHPAAVAATKVLDYMQFVHENPEAMAQYVQSFHERRTIREEANVEELASRGIHLERTRRGRVKRFPSLFKEDILAEQYQLRQDALFAVQTPEEIASEAAKRGAKGKASLKNVVNGGQEEMKSDEGQGRQEEEALVELPSVLVDAIAEVHVRPMLSSFVALARVAADAGDAVLAQALLLRIFHWGLLADEVERERSPLAAEQLKHLLLVAICDRKSMTVAQASVFFTLWESMKKSTVKDAKAYAEQPQGFSWPSWLWPDARRSGELISLPLFANIDFSLPPPPVPTVPHGSTTPWMALSPKNIPAPLLEAMLDATSFSQAWEDAFSTEKTLNYLREQRQRAVKEEKLRAEADIRAEQELREQARIQARATVDEARGTPSLRVAEIITTGESAFHAPFPEMGVRSEELDLFDVDGEGQTKRSLNEDVDEMLDEMEERTNQLHEGVEGLEAMEAFNDLEFDEEFDLDADDAEYGAIEIPEEAEMEFTRQMEALEQQENKEKENPQELLQRANEIGSKLFQEDYGRLNLLGEADFSLLDVELLEEIAVQQQHLESMSGKFDRLQKKLMNGRVEMEEFDRRVAELDEITAHVTGKIQQLGELARLRKQQRNTNKLKSTTTGDNELFNTAAAEEAEEAALTLKTAEERAQKRREMLDLRLRAKKNILDDNASIKIPGIFRGDVGDLPAPDPNIEVEPNGVFQSVTMTLDEMPKSFSAWFLRQFDKDTEKSKHDPKSKVPGGVGFIEPKRSLEEIQARRQERFEAAMHRRLALIRRLLACVEGVSSMMYRRLSSSVAFASSFHLSRQHEVRRVLDNARVHTDLTASDIATIERSVPALNLEELDPALPSLNALGRLIRLNSAMSYHSFSFTTAHMDNAQEPFAVMVETAKPAVDKSMNALGRTWGLVSSRAYWLPPRNVDVVAFSTGITTKGIAGIAEDIATFSSMSMNEQQEEGDSTANPTLSTASNENVEELTQSLRLVATQAQVQALKRKRRGLSADSIANAKAEATADIHAKMNAETEANAVDLAKISPIAIPLSVHATVEASLSQSPRLRLVVPSSDAISAFSRLRDQYNTYLSQQRNKALGGGTFDPRSLVGPQLVRADTLDTSDSTSSAIVAPLIKPSGRIVLDLGAGDGEHAIHMALQHPEDLVIANEIIEHSAADILFKVRVASLQALRDPLSSHKKLSSFGSQIDAAAARWSGAISASSSLSLTQPPMVLAGDMTTSVFASPIVPRAGEVSADRTSAIPPGAVKIENRVELPGLANLLVHAGSGSDLLASIPTNSVDKIVVVHPPPPAMTRKAYFTEVKQRKASAFNKITGEENEAISISGQAPKLVSKKAYEEVVRDALLSEPFLWLAAKALRTGAYVHLQSSDTRVWQWLLETLSPDQVKYAATDAQARDRVNALFDPALFVQEFGKPKLDTPEEAYINRLHRKLSASPRLSDYFVVQEVFERDGDFGPRSKFEVKNAERTVANGKRERMWRIIRTDRPWM